MSAAYLEYLFPQLTAEGFALTSPQNVRYNCIAWAAGDEKRCWWPDANYLYYWPDPVRGDYSVDAFAAAFERDGFTRCGSDASHEPGFEKIAIYAKGAKTTHMARELPDGNWTSKCGDLEDIRHILSGLEGDEYGRIVLILKRPSHNP